MNTIYRELELFKKKNTEKAYMLRRENEIFKLTAEKEFFRSESISLDKKMK
jgi:hypothetical protein